MAVTFKVTALFFQYKAFLFSKTNNTLNLCLKKGITIMRISNTVKPLNTDNPTIDDDYLFAASYNDVTGLIPTVAHNEYEAASYDQIAHYLPPIAPNPVNDLPGSSLSQAEGIHAEVNTLDKNTSSAKDLEGNHRLPSTHLYDK